MNKLDEIALRVAETKYSQLPEECMEFLHDVLAELSKDEPVAIADCHEVHGSMCQFLERTRYGMDNIKNGDKLYLHPANTAEIEQRVADYEEVMASHRRLVHELDVAINGEDGAAKQASLCDIVSQVKSGVVEQLGYNAARAELEATIAEKAAEIERLKDALTPKPAPEGLVPHGFMLESTRQNAEFWYKAGNSEEAKTKGESIICMAQAVFAWKNAAYAMAEKVLAQQAYAEQLRALVKSISGQAPEKPDYWASCGQCERNISDAEELAAIPHDTTALREYCARVVEKVATMTLSTYALKTIAALIREGTFVPD